MVHPVESARGPQTASARRRLRAPLRSGCGPQSARCRSGFTLTEMLVVITIFVILLAMTITAVNVSMDRERIRSAARQMQSYIEGARDRAIFAKLPRGVRFLIDAKNPAAGTSPVYTVSSMIYVGATEDWSEGEVHVFAPGGRANVIEGVGAGWHNLYRRGLLEAGNKIKLGGLWYTVTDLGTVPAATNPGGPGADGDFASAGGRGGAQAAVEWPGRAFRAGRVPPAAVTGSAAEHRARAASLGHRDRPESQRVAAFLAAGSGGGELQNGPDVFASRSGHRGAGGQGHHSLPAQ
ncbi:MAG: prepilin-type N-terminal cleavage/methylation domain-containing protein [Planctomycetota bacterium]|nr:MAG: prepilin-type N-terminal cleavage/methylation domain-containing protein [Planctomycetota bacterium]